ncbi:hypothetical protein GcM1_195019 [Golovinomyces cichoracearum]|uniref:Glucose-repressible alcohol dehydrogenase transcriptional effector n=1 Tax=Golovinomyces cichoracearum TaxID=62708 RepID=A0A420J0F2_9PEZI|nr:hypothetical protein GcM1_195019 [Golovinomyces cichoracearum]
MSSNYTLPQLPPNRTTDSNTKILKRPRASSPIFSSDSIFSSDPIFSSEDDEPSCENYIQERHKKKTRGPWFLHHPANIKDDITGQNTQRNKRSFKRNTDSGVFLGSDSSDSDEFLKSFESNKPVIKPIRSKILPCSSSPEDLALQRIQFCLEEGNETIDLSSLGLKSLSNEAVKQLSYFVRVPNVSEGLFTVLEPELKIFLASNQLTTLPHELFNLKHLEVLSLRGNLIHDLAPGIGNLLNLKELNLSQNRLSHLPFEILNLISEKGSLESLSLHPNPFYEPQFPTGAKLWKPINRRDNPEDSSHNDQNFSFSLSKHENDNIWSSKWKVLFQASTEVRFMDINGSLVKGPAFTASGSQTTLSSLPVAKWDYDPISPTPRGDSLSRVPSLLETALNSCAKTQQLPSLTHYLPEDTPTYIYELLDLVSTDKERGSSYCTMCGRKFIIARTEWIEWWEISKDRSTNTSPSYDYVLNDRDYIERMVPLIRRGCSWLCVPTKIISQ